MRKKVYRLFLALLTACCALYATMCFAQTVSSAELINNAKDYDGKTITYEGEVIGDVMSRGEYAWINVNDGQNAIGIWAEKRLTKEIVYAGSYKTRGDWIAVVGVFHRVCLSHGGDLDIHAQTINRLRPGRPVIEMMNPGKRNLALIFAGALCLVLILRQLRRR